MINDEEYYELNDKKEINTDYKNEKRIRKQKDRTVEKEESSFRVIKREG